ncbi:uncharacterized protein PHACADRAFT_209427 [Phanerochaete carnosa HHB-10118-sp]|uniref:Uncharacterized protein n=1 Tax=Phanerochaete carnosa (strain HHB-10118-sp) TaxID=650164 RepID=K5WAC4_PHACS|nr:uncharacterized protein PHACADRAFT_209427 [Phanerochaete carnosa HHB-10118-sp]EKM55914.1 hypothetical protein PHACADRAFT_209427 [Phanerochaete carnosa HHB-10118-sp]
MNRFRKKSDVKRAVQTVDALREVQVARVNTQHQPNPLASLPPSSDFRTSLILPDLTRRFSVLRNSAGEPIGLDELKSRFAEQRARGSENRVSEEEEDMILEALGRLRGQGRPKPVTEDSTGDERVSTAFSESQDAGSRMSGAPSLAGGQSVRSNVTAASATSSALHGSSSAASFTSSKGSQAARRMSNNLFGSGKFHDHTYMRTAHTRRGAGSSAPGSHIGAVKHADSTTSMSTVTSSRAAGNGTSLYSDNQSLRPVTPDGSAYASSVPSSPINTASYIRDAGSSDGLSGTMSPKVLVRASLALDEVMRELEEEGDDQIVMERSPIAVVPPPIQTNTTITTTSYSGSPARYQPDTSPLTSSPPTSATDEEPGMALSSDEPTASQSDVYQSSPSPYPRASNSSPGPRLPGYIPGMPRPMTPRDRETSFDTEDQTPSTTPRATSPRLPGSSSTQPPPLLAQTLSSNVHRSNSSTSTHRDAATPVTPTASTSPLFFSRSTNGRYTPEGRDRSYSSSDSAFPALQDGTDFSSRRRPISPLSSSPYQPLPIAAVSSASSRPSTPSNVTWLSPSTPDGTRGHVRNGFGSTSTSGRSRSGSSVSITDAVASSYEADRTEPSGSSRSTTSATTTRPSRTPDISDSQPNWYNNRSQSSASVNGTQDYRSPSAMSSTIDPGSPTRPFRSPTPNHSLQNLAASPTASSFNESNGYANGSGFSSSSRRTSRQNAHSSFTLSPGHALLLSPLGNSSRSSLESGGSSYHSWDEDHKKDRLFDLFTHLDPSFTEWHELSGQASTSQTTPNESKESQEEFVRKETGLTKNDILAVQDKLVAAALTKAATPEGRNRAGSVRRRRPSTSQSNYSTAGAENRVASPPPQAQTQVAPARPISSDQIAKASALLDSVVDSINSPRSKAMSVVPPDDVAVLVHPPPEPVASSPGQRQRALADALFGSEDPDRTLLSSPTTPSTVLRTESPSINIADEPSPTIAGPSAAPGNELLPQSPSVVEEIASAVTSSAMLSPSHVNPMLFEAEVQRRIEAATAALRKSPSSPKLDGGSTRKRISPNQISSPTLVSASTSVDTIPLGAPTIPVQSRTAHSSSARFGSRFKKLTGTLRAKTPIPAANEEFHSISTEIKTPTSSQSISYNPEQLITRDQPAISSATETGRFKVSPPPVITPPTSAGPGLRGFMSRFRKQRPGEITALADKPLASATVRPTTASPAASRMDPPRTSADSQMRSAPAAQGQFTQLRPLSPQSPLSQTFPEAIPEDAVPPASAPLPRIHDSNDEAALKQLYDAAVNLGLDQEALHDLVARSPSTTSRTTTWSKLARNNSVATRRRTQQTDSLAPQSPILSEGRPSVAESHSSIADARPSVTESRLSVSEGRPSISDVRPSFSDGRPSTEAVLPRPSAEIRQLTIRKHADASSASRPTPQPNSDPRRTIVRRTIIVPSDSRVPGMDLQEMLRRQSTSQRRRSAGAGSISSNRSLQDRAPTPPPPRSSTSRRFSTDRTPPVPSLPPSFTAQAGALHPPTQIEKSSSTYDSLVDMYSGDNRATSTTNADVAGPSSQADEATPESGPALEVIEYANGETIWSIVNGLRDDDTESFFDNRASFASDYSGEGVKVFFKEHGRKSSKSSGTSFLSRKKQSPSASQRPETKVFFSSSGQIARLIENMSRDVDAGSFNITPDRIQGHAGHSASSSLDMRWTLEERLEHMLGSVSSNS